MTQWSGSGCGTELLWKCFSKQGSKSNHQKGYAWIQTQEKKKDDTRALHKHTLHWLQPKRLIFLTRANKDAGCRGLDPDADLGRSGELPATQQPPMQLPCAHLPPRCMAASTRRSWMWHLVRHWGTCSWAYPAAPGCEQPGPLTELNGSIFFLTSRCQSRRTLLRVWR